MKIQEKKKSQCLSDTDCLHFSLPVWLSLPGSPKKFEFAFQVHCCLFIICRGILLFIYFLQFFFYLFHQIFLNVSVTKNKRKCSFAIEIDPAGFPVFSSAETGGVSASSVFPPPAAAVGGTFASHCRASAVFIQHWCSLFQKNPVAPHPKYKNNWFPCY